MSKIFIQSIFPAPYRSGLFELISKNYESTVFFEKDYDENRNSSWFIKDFTYNCYLLTDNNCKNKYKNEIKKLKGYDLVLVYDYSTKLSMKLMLKCIINHIPYVLNCDGAFIKPHPIKDQIKYFFIKRASACLANGEYSKRYFQYFGAEEKKIFIHKFSSLYEKDILKDFIPQEYKAKLKKRLGIEDKPTAIAVGQFIYRKGFDILINSWTDVDKNYNLIIIGGGENKQLYEKKINELGLNNIKLINFMNNEVLKKYYRACDLFVLPTREDVWGLVINEAMANGLPVITTDKCIAGLELVKNMENGFIVAVNDKKILSEKINYILNDYKLAETMADKNLKKIKHYTIEKMANDHMKVISDILNNKL